jgi:hypothetical protein
MAAKPKMAVLAFGSPKGGKSPPEGDDMGMDEADEEAPEPSDEFTALATRLFPDVDPAELKELIHMCLEEGYS